ncbi:MAG: hypothetical protein LUF90_00775 [Rikenellaceae bacterium]|nr:hypothetical protein [Rikenellaceae bacterium]
MTQIGNVSEIISVKKTLEELKNDGLIENWELPYEEILTRLTAAIFFLSPTDKTKMEEIWNVLSGYEMLHYRPNEEKRLSQLEWMVEFNKGFEL